MGKSWNSLSRDDQVKLELKASIDPIFFCENEYFLGQRLYREPAGTSQYDIIKTFFLSVFAARGREATIEVY